jgi:hypothetical protein
VRAIIFRVLVGLGSALLVFALLFSQTKSDDRTVDKAFFRDCGRAFWQVR